jgi:Tol biopolymer transport system component
MVFRINMKRITSRVEMGLSVLLLLWCGCESIQPKKQYSAKPVATSQVSAEPAAKDSNAMAQLEYNARISAMTGRTIRSGRPAYRQVAYGAVPAVDQPSRSLLQAQTNQSIEQHTFATEGACFDPKISPDGKLMVYASTQHSEKPDIYIKQIDSTAMTQLTSHPASDVEPSFSADSRRIAFCSDRTGNWDIFVIDSDGRNLQQVTEDPAPEMHPSISPDGKKLAYCRYNGQAGQWEIWLLNLENPGERKYIAAGLFPCFSTKDNVIVYQRPSQRGGQLFNIWTIRLTEEDQPSMPTQIASSPDRSLIGPQWSQDGTKVAFCSVRPLQNGETIEDAQIWIVNADGGDRMPVTEPGIACFNPTWGADGRLFFSANRGDCENVWSILPIINKTSQVARAKPENQQRFGQATAARQNYAATDPGNGSAVKANQPILLVPADPIQMDQHSTVEVMEQ